MYTTMLTSAVLAVLATVAAGGDVLCQPGQCPPTQLHMMLRPDGVGVSFLWQTFARSNTSTVWLSEGSACHSGAGAHTINSTRQNSISPSSTGYNVMFNHLVDAPTLKPTTRYSYCVGDLVGGVSASHSFRTGPPPKRISGSFQARVGVLGDMGLANSQKTIAMMQNKFLGNQTADFIFHIGDISYADDYPSYLYERVWEQWFENMQGILTKLPYMTGPGNHEYGDDDKDAGTTGFHTYIVRFALPVKSFGGNTPMWYSFDRGNVHYVVTSTETDFPNAFFPTKFGDQLKWLAADLAKANANRAVRPWIVVGGHRPIYSAAKGFVQCDSHNYKCWPHGQSDTVKHAFEGLFEQYNVDVVISGHVHSYSRTYGVGSSGAHISKQTHNAQLPWYIVTGGAGNEEGLSKDYLTSVPWNAHIYKDGYSAGELLIEEDDRNKVHKLTWNLYRSNDQGLEDTFTLTKDY